MIIILANIFEIFSSNFDIKKLNVNNYSCQQLLPSAA